MNQKAMGAWILAASMAPILHDAPAGWLVAAAEAAILLPLAGYAGRAMDEPGKGMAALELIWCIPVMTVVVKNCAVYWPSEAPLAVPLTILALGAIGAQRKTAGRSSAGMLPVLLLLSIPMLLAGIREIEPENLRGIPHYGINGLTLGLMLPVFLREPKKILLTEGTGAILATALVQGILGAELCGKLETPFYVAVQTFRLGAGSRMEAICAVVMSLSSYAFCGLVLSRAAGWAEVLNMKAKTGIELVTALTAVAAVIGLETGFSRVLAGGTVAVWGLIPALKRKVEKGEKRC